MKTSSQHFLAAIYKIWMMRHVEVPAEVADALVTQLHGVKRGARDSRRKPAKPKHIPVVALVNHCATRTTLVPAGAGRYRLQINTALRNAAGGADAGDVIGISIQLDTKSREIAVPAELTSALKAHPKARQEFDLLPAGHRRQLLLYYLRAKSPRARVHVTARFLDHLRERALLRQPRAKPKAATSARRK